MSGSLLIRKTMSRVMFMVLRERLKLSLTSESMEMSHSPTGPTAFARATPSAVMYVRSLRAAAEHFDELASLWEKMHA